MAAKRRLMLIEGWLGFSGEIFKLKFNIFSFMHGHHDSFSDDP